MATLASISSYTTDPTTCQSALVSISCSSTASAVCRVSLDNVVYRLTVDGRRAVDFTRCLLHLLLLLLLLPTLLLLPLDGRPLKRQLGRRRNGGTSGQTVVNSLRHLQTTQNIDILNIVSHEMTAVAELIPYRVGPVTSTNSSDCSINLSSSTPAKRVTCRVPRSVFVDLP